MTDRRIVFISKGEDSASTRYRALDYFPYFEGAGWRPHHLTYRGAVKGATDYLQTARRADVVVVLRRTMAWPLLLALRNAAKFLVFDFDDAIFLKSSGEPSSRREARFRRMVRICDAVWAGNRHLASHALNYNTRVNVIPTSINPEKYTAMTTKPSDHIVLVWIGSQSTRKHLLTAMPQLEAAARAVPNLSLKIIADFALHSETLNIRSIPWSAESETSELASAHIGIAPLPDNPWTRGKCGLKVLQYMAAGLPVISSSTGVNAELVEHGSTGFLADNAEEWISAIRALADNAEQRIAMGHLGRARCAQHFSRDSTFQRMLVTLPR